MVVGARRDVAIALSMLLTALLAGQVLAGCGGARGPSAGDFPETGPVERTATDRPAPVEVLLYRAEYELDEKGGFVRTVHQRYRVLSEGGVVGWGSTEARWSPWYMKRPQVSATVTPAGGEATALDPKTISDAAAYPEAPDIYGDTRVLRAPLPKVAVGAVVDEVIRVETKQPFFGGAYTHYEVLQAGVPREKVEIVIDMPAGAPFRHEVHDAAVETSDETRDGRRRIELRGGPYPAIEELEPLVPFDVAPWPYLAFSSADSWAPLVHSYGQLVEQELAGAQLGEVAREVVADDDTPRVKAAKLLHWLSRRVRYAGIEFGESAIRPRGPLETLKRGYGDCKDQAVLLVGLLRAAGVPAHVALLRAGYGDDVRSALPALNVFNHAIVVTEGDEPLWIDPTSPYARAGELPGPDQDRLALVIRDGNDNLTRTSGGQVDDNGYDEQRTVQLADQGRAVIREKTTASGFIERDLRASFDVSRAEQQEGLKQYVARTYNSDTLGDFESSRAAELEQPFELRVEARNAQVAITGMLDAEVLVDPSVLYRWIPAALSEGKERKIDLLLPTPYHARLRYEIRPPEGFVPSTLPMLTDRKLGPATLTRKIEAKSDGVVTLRYEFRVPQRRWSAADVRAFGAAFEKLTQEPSPRVSFLHEGQKHSLAHDPRGELAAYRRLVRAHPDSGLHKMRLAISLVDLGFGATARKIAAEAVELDPDNAALHFHQGDLLSRDLLGRSMQKGFDPVGAARAFRRATELDPDDVGSVVTLALLHEYDDDGIRYSAKSKLDESVAIYESIDPEKLAAHQNGTFVHNALYALMYAGRFQEVRERLAHLDPAAVPPVLAIVCAAALGGPADGLAEVVRLEVDSDSRASVLESAAQTLLRLRYYEEAAAMTQASGASSSDTSAIIRARVQKQIRKVDPLTMPVRNVEDAVVRAFSLYASRPDQGQERAREIFSSRAVFAKGKSGSQAFFLGVAKASEAMDLPPPVLGDLFAASYATESEGDDATGYRVTLRARAASVVQQVFVVREQGGYRIRTIGLLPSELGCEALHLAKSGKQTQARKWLAWAQDLVTSPGGDDPLRLSPYERLWSSGKGDALLSAAALCSQGEQGELAIPTLEEARKKASGVQQTIFDQALMQAYDGVDAGKCLEAARRLEAAEPSSRRARYAVRVALGAAGKSSEVRSRVKQLLAKSPDDPGLLGVLLVAEERAGNLAEAQRVGKKLIATGKATAGDENQWAWRALFLDQVNDEAIGYALHAAQTPDSSQAALHTLACLYADAGRIHEARQTFTNILATRPRQQPEPDDWYIVGRIAEHLDLPDEARAAYGHASASDGEHLSTGTLARTRLSALR